MKRLVLLLMFVLLLSLLTTPTLAQENTTTGCDVNTLTAAITEIIGTLESAQASLEGGDTASSVATLFDAENALANLRLQCSGMTFQGSAATVLGPIDFPDGTYRVTATTSGFFIAELQPISGTCETQLFGSLFTLMSGQATSGAEATFTARSCSTLVNVSNITAPWTLTFENLTSPQLSSGAASPQPTATISASTEGNLIQYNTSVDGFLFANMTAEYFFEGNTGDVVTIGAIRSEGTADLALELYDPNGSLLFSDDDSNPEGVFNPMMSNLPLPATGRYRIVVTRCSFCDANESANFRLSIQVRQ